MHTLFITLGVINAYPHLATGCNYLLGLSAIVGTIRCVFAILGANHNGRWEEAKTKIGAYFLLILGPILVKTVWIIIDTKALSTWE